jgi:hypothetical protein
MFQQQFRAEETLFSDSTNNELLIIYLATVWAEVILFSRLRKAVKRYRQAYRRHCYYQPTDQNNFN